jgi:DNA-binding response OmpR family regulator
MLPGMNGLEICRRLRREPATCLTPIVMVTARTSEAEVAAGFDLGADDYVRKPFSVRELVARVRALLRRVGADVQVYEDEQLSIDFAGMKVTCEGREVRLTRKEFALLAALVECAGRVATRKHLMERVWGHQYYGGERTLDVHIRRLRQNLGRCGERIETVAGVGYRLAGVGPGSEAAGVDRPESGM